MKAHKILLLTGLFILIFSLAKIVQQMAAGLNERSPLPADYPWRYEMDTAANGNGYITVLGRVGQ